MAIGWEIDSPLWLAISARVVLVIPMLTYFFASRRPLFVRIFGHGIDERDREEMETQLPANDQFERGMKIMAAIQLTLPLGMLIGAIVWWWRG